VATAVILVGRQLWLLSRGLPTTVRLTVAVLLSSVPLLTLNVKLSPEATCGR